jgi:hypothetical protein
LAVALAALPFLAAMVHSAMGADERHPQRLSRTQLCQGVRRAARDVAARYSNVPRERLDAAAKEACSHDPVYAQVAEAKPVATSPGCHLFAPADRHRSRPRTATPPKRRIPFFAARSGSVPPSGTPVVGGVQLPEGSRCGPFWSTDAGVEDWSLPRRLAAVFPRTGLWPVVWEWASEEPDSYVYGGGNPARADRLDAETLLRHGWKTSGFARTVPFPGMATAEAEAERMAVDPFGEIAQGSLFDAPPPGGWIMMLVPVNRPADVYSVLRPRATEYWSDDALTAILRSWEERFGVSVTALSPSSLELAVAAPPRDDDQAHRLSAEQAAFAPEDDGMTDLAVHAQRLRANRIIQGVASAHYWVFGWPD